MTAFKNRGMKSITKQTKQYIITRGYTFMLHYKQGTFFIKLVQSCLCRRLTYLGQILRYIEKYSF